MTLFRYIAMLMVLVFPVSLSACSQQVKTSDAGHRPPNIVLIVADDLGHGDLGYLGSEIPTPNLDSLAKEGMILTNFYANMACAPTRAMLMSGIDNHPVGLGWMGPTLPQQTGQPGYEGYLNDRAYSMAEYLRDAGYNTYMTGKWHLGETEERSAHARGFTKSFTSIDGGAHLGGLSWLGPEKARYRDNRKLTFVNDDFYTTREFTTRMIDFIEEDRSQGRPFFAYLAYTAPHWPLQAPQASIDKFKGLYDLGYEALYRKRFARMVERGFIPVGPTGSPLKSGQKKWEELSESEKRIESRKMEIYAAMVNDLDAYIGEFLDYLDDIGERDNTFIFFMSDNGPEGLRRDLISPIKDWVEACCDNSYDNMGKADSYVMYGPNWARASTVAFRDTKGTAYNGGVRVPALAFFPNHIKGNTRNDQFMTVMDVLPTVLDLAESSDFTKEKSGTDLLQPTGKSALASFGDRNLAVHDENAIIGWDLWFQRGIYNDGWKLVWDGSQTRPNWQLFDLSKDPFEQNDLSNSEPDKLSEMLTLWDSYKVQNGIKP